VDRVRYLSSRITETRNRGRLWSLPNRQQDIGYGIPESFQPSPLCRHFRSGIKHGNPHNPSAGMTILNPIPVLHLDARCVGHWPMKFVASAVTLASSESTQRVTLVTASPRLDGSPTVDSISVEHWIIVKPPITEVQSSPSSVSPRCQARFFFPAGLTFAIFFSLISNAASS
jgi:hypothetical protein